MRPGPPEGPVETSRAAWPSRCLDRRTAWSRPLGGTLLADGAFELSLHERIEIAVEDRPGVARLVVRPQVFDHLVRMQDVASDLVAPARLDVLAFELADLFLLFLESPFEEAGLEDLDGHLLVLGLASLVLALCDDPGAEVRQPD